MSIHIFYTGIGAKPSGLHTSIEFLEILITHKDNFQEKLDLEITFDNLDALIEWCGASY